MRKHLGPACVLVMLAGGSAAAAPNVQFDLIGPAGPIAPGAEPLFKVAYAVDGADLDNVVIHWDIPRGVVPVGVAASGDFSLTCEPDVPGDSLKWSCDWLASSIEVPGGGVAGEIPILLHFVNWQFANGVNVVQQATLAADWNDGIQSGSVGPLTATTSTLIEGTASVSLITEWGRGARLNRTTGYAIVDGTPGFTSGIEVMAYNAGTIGVEPASQVTVTLPADARVVTFEADPDDPVALTPLGSGTFAVEFLQGVGWHQLPADGAALGSQRVNEVVARRFWLAIWRPCSADPMSPGDTIGVTWNGTLRGGTAGVLATATVHPEPALTTRDASSCPGPAALSMDQSALTIGPGERGPFTLQLFPPKVEVPVYDAFMSVPIPAGMALDSMPQQSIARVFTCHLPSQVAPLTAADFALVRNTDCTEGSASGPVSGTPTHLVALLDNWSASSPVGPIIWSPLAIDLPLRATVCEVGSLHMDGYASFATTPGGAIQVLTTDHDVAVTIASQPFYYATPGVVSAVRGGTQTLPFALGTDVPALNPTLTLALPPGVVVTDLRLDFRAASCASEPPLFASWSVAADPNGPPGATLLTIPTGDATHPWYLTQGCACGPGGNVFLDLELYFDAAHPFTNDQQIAVVANVTADNMAPGYVPATYSPDLRMLVPLEERLTIAPECDALEGHPTYDVTYRNSGGVPLSNVVVETSIPRIGDGSATEVDTLLFDASADLGTVTCFDGATWSATCDASATRVRVSIATLPPHTLGALRVRLDAPGAAAGDRIYGQGTMTADGVFAIQSMPANPVVFDSCPGRLDVSIWWDDAAGTLGLLDPGELGAPGWTVQLVNQSTSDTLSFPVGAAGLMSESLAAGTYDITFLPPGNAVFSINPTQPTTVVILPFATTEVGFGLSCACDDGSSCTTDRCSIAGECVFSEPVGGCCGNGEIDPGEDCDDGNFLWSDGCFECACSIGNVAGPEGCVPRCGDGLVMAGEACDDGNTVANDGCSATCTLEPGSDCEPSVVSQCLPNFLCGGALPDWYDETDPAYDWVPAAQSLCPLSPFDCSDVATLTCDAPDDPDCRLISVCALCESMATTVCGGDGCVPSQCPLGGGRIFGTVTTPAGPRSFRCDYVDGSPPECDVERDGNGAPVLVGGAPVLALYSDLVCE